MPAEIIPIDRDHVSDYEIVCMALRKEDKEAIIKEVVKEVVEQLRPTGARRVAAFILELGPAIAYVALVATLLATLVTALIYAFSRVEKEAIFETKTDDRLTGIEAQLRILTASQTPARVLQDISTLNEKQFAINLPALKKVVEQPATKVLPTPELLQDIGLKLQKVSESTKSTNDYWLTVLQFIQFASASYAPKAPPPGSPVNVYLGNNHGAGISVPPGGVYQLSGEIANITFTNSRIIFTDQPVFLKNVRFINCAFEFPQALSPSLENTGQQLLASGIKTAYVAGM